MRNPTLLTPLLSQSPTRDFCPHTPLNGENARTPILERPPHQSRVPSYIPDYDSIATKDNSSATFKPDRHRQSKGSWALRLAGLIGPMTSIKNFAGSKHKDKQFPFDQLTSTDWVHDSIVDAGRIKELKSGKGIESHLQIIFDKSQAWILCAVVGILTAFISVGVNMFEAPLFDWKFGLCANGYLFSEKKCCPIQAHCDDWKSWSTIIHSSSLSDVSVQFLAYMCITVLFAITACLLTLTTKTALPNTFPTFAPDVNLTLNPQLRSASYVGPLDPTIDQSGAPIEAMPYYAAAGSGIVEVRVRLSGFIFHGLLGFKTLAVKTLALILSVSSGLSLGKEGPFVHIAACVGNIVCGTFSKYDNDRKRREFLGAIASVGVAVTFGAPMSGILFGLEEISHFLPPETLFRTFFCCISSALTLKFLDQYGTQRIAMFEVRYYYGWEIFELFPFIVIGILGGATGAIFTKSFRVWNSSVRPSFLRNPLLEVFLVASVTGLVSFWNPFTKLPVSKLLYHLASPCDNTLSDDLGICPQTIDGLKSIIPVLAIAFLVKGLLTVITFSIKVPLGIYIPSMAIGSLEGRIIGHAMQLVVLRFPESPIFKVCAANTSRLTCITPGAYAFVAAGTTLCGVTRLSVTLTVILLELSGSLEHVLPISFAIIVAKWTADAIEPLSIYELLTEINSYPLLNHKHKPVFDSELEAIVPPFKPSEIIDISRSPLLSVDSLRTVLANLKQNTDFVCDIPILRNKALVGVIQISDLSQELDRLHDESQGFCLMTNVPTNEVEMGLGFSPANLATYVDPAPITVDIRSPTNLVHECFMKLGPRYICFSREGDFAGMVSKYNVQSDVSLELIVLRFIAPHLSLKYEN
ncbi:voltage-gated chloride channel (ClcA) [Blumeria hordei DH14]|uniref:Voltage-gated chloride channel (ClcA) n=1 Tax=Blumeria graminis f. sp. hordei (strain DH14) TaxID=546991 RepID=N1JIN7_BLUG1|nr:voltage-gated chloride channel (ClcA) [Blumeria hordei DH14]